MEEKILIKSELAKNVKNILQKGPLVMFGVTALISIILSFTADTYERTSWYSDYGSTIYVVKLSGWDVVFRFGEYTFYFILFVIACLSFITAIVLGIMYLVYRKCEICITENNVRGKTILGKEVVLPLYMISAYSTRKFLSTVAISSASGITKFALIGNYVEIGNILAQKINERQNKTVNEAPKSDSMDDLVKLKSLLDAGVITQEDFDAKKKQLLNL